MRNCSDIPSALLVQARARDAICDAIRDARQAFMALLWLGGDTDAICSSSGLACNSFDIFCLSGTSSSCLSVWNLPCLGLHLTGL